MATFSAVAVSSGNFHVVKGPSGNFPCSRGTFLAFVIQSRVLPRTFSAVTCPANILCSWGFFTVWQHKRVCGSLYTAAAICTKLLPFVQIYSP